METREGTALGGFVTFAVYPLSIVYILMLFDEVKRAPPAQTRDILWTSQEAGGGVHHISTSYVVLARLNHV